MHKQFYFLSPVEVIKVTPQNMEEVAEWCGGKVSQIESRKKPGQMDKFVHVPMAKESNQSSAYPGMYVTKRMVITVDNKLKVTYAVFRKDYFDKNYFDSPALAVDMTWERSAREEAEALKNSPVAAAFERAQERATPKPAEPKKKHKHIPEPNINQLMGPEYKEKTFDESDYDAAKLQKALDVIQEIMPGAKVIAVEDNLEDLSGDVTAPRGGIKFGEKWKGLTSVVEGPVDEPIPGSDEWAKQNPRTVTKTYEESMADLQKRYDAKEITLEQYRAIRDSQQKPVAEEATTS